MTTKFIRILLWILVAMMVFSVLNLWTDFLFVRKVRGNAGTKVPEVSSLVETQIESNESPFNEVQELVQLANLERESVGLYPLIETPILDERATMRAQELCDSNQWSHEGWAKAFEGLSSDWVGENLSKYFQDEESAHRALMASEKHRANILSERFQYIGVGHACDIEVELFLG